jgi:chromosome segregation ATPase
MLKQFKKALTTGMGVMKNKSYESLTENLERQERLEDELKGKNEQKRELSFSIGRINRELLEVKNAIKGYSVEGARSGAGFVGYKEKLKVNQEKAAKLEAELIKAKGEMAALDKAIAAITAELSEFEHDANISQVLAHQKAIEAEQTELGKYQELIEEQKKKISDASIKENKIAPLISRREELLADIALGKAGAEELADLDQDIARTRQAQEAEQSSNAQIITDANNTISGLERRTESIKARIAELNHLTPGVLDGLIMGIAQQTADEFNRIAQDMAQKLIELAALDALVSTFGKRHNTGLFPNQAWIAKIPNINNVEPCTALNGDQYHYFSAGNRMINVDAAIQQLKQDLIDQGVNI